MPVMGINALSVDQMISLWKNFFSIYFNGEFYRNKNTKKIKIFDLII